MRKALSAAQSLLTAALVNIKNMSNLLARFKEWLADSKARPGAVGEKAIRRILDYSEKIASRSLPEDQIAIRQSVLSMS